MKKKSDGFFPPSFSQRRSLQATKVEREISPLSFHQAMEEPHSPPPRAAPAEEGSTTLLDLDIEILRLVRRESSRHTQTEKKMTSECPCFFFAVNVESRATTTNFFPSCFFLSAPHPSDQKKNETLHRSSSASRRGTSPPPEPPARSCAVRRTRAPSRRACGRGGRGPLWGPLPRRCSGTTLRLLKTKKEKEERRTRRRLRGQPTSPWPSRWTRWRSWGTRTAVEKKKAPKEKKPETTASPPMPTPTPTPPRRGPA